MQEIIGVAGTNGAGKDTLSIVRERHHNILTINLGQMLRNSLSSDITPTRETLSNHSQELRQKMGNGVLSILALKEYAAQKGEDTTLNGLTINSVRHPDEARVIQEAGGIVVWVDAPIEARYDRIQKGRLAEGRPEDHVSFEEFRRQQEREMDSQDPTRVNLLATRGVADITMENTFDTKEAFERFIEKQSWL